MSAGALERLLGGADGAGTLERMMGGLLSAAHVTGWIKDRERRYLYATPAWEAQAGVSPGAVIGLRDEAFRAAETAERYRAIDERILAEGITDTREDVTNGADGPRWFMVTKFPLRDATGAIVGIGGVVTETTAFRSLHLHHRADETLLSRVLESTPDLICRFTPDLTVTFANPAFTATYARLGETVVDRALGASVPKPLASDFAAAVARLSTATEQTAFDEVTHDPLGRPRWREYRVRGAFAPDGRLMEVQATGRDVTDERRYMGALERMVSTANARAASLAETVATLLSIGLDYFDMDLAGIGRFVHGAFEVEHMQRRDGSVHLPIARVPGEETIGTMTHDVNAPVAIEDLASEPLPSVVLDGAQHIRSFIGQRIEVAGAIYGTVMFCGKTPRQRPFRANDLTLQRLLAQWLAFVFERHNQVAALSRRQAELQVILETVPARIATRDRDGALIIANAAARGREPPPESREEDARAIASGEPSLGRLERWEDADGQIRWMRTDRVPLEDPASGAPRLLVVASEVTELVEKEQALADANEGLKQFAYIASHDLQEPLRKIGTFTDILEEALRSGNGEETAYAMRVIRDGARRSSRLIRDLLAWSRITNQPIDRQPVRLDRLVRETVQEVASGRPDETVTVDDALAALTVRADATQVRQLVENLVVNALKYRHPERPPHLRLRLGRTGAAGAAVLEIEDNGIGFLPQYAQQIFEPFRRLHTERDYPGSGVGLAICQRVCERHGWTIAATGRPAVGAVFRIEMPRRTLMEG